MNPLANNAVPSREYADWLQSLKQRIIAARHKAALSLNSSLLELYWHVGREISEKESEAGWGSGFIDRLSRDLSFGFKDMKGFSRRNLYAIRQWYRFYSSAYQFVPQPVAQIPWGHNRLIIAKIRNIKKALVIHKPIGISDYILTQEIPEAIRHKLPTVAELENELPSRISKADAPDAAMPPHEEDAAR